MSGASVGTRPKVPDIQEVMGLDFKEVRGLAMADKEQATRDIEATTPPCPTQPSLPRGFKVCFTQHRELLATPIYTLIQASHIHTKPLLLLNIKLPLLFNTKVLPLLQALLLYLELPLALELGQGD